MFRLFALFCSFLSLVAGEARAATYQPLKTHENYCLDHTGGSMINGTKPQIWTCNGGKNQNWQLKPDGHLKSAPGLCLDLTDGRRQNGAPVQMYACADNNANQLWEMAGNSLRLKGTSLCLDVIGGGYWDSAQLQVWQCDGLSTGNQAWSWGQTSSSAGTSSSSSSNFYGYEAIPIEQFCQMHPECAPYKDAFVAAAADQGLHPTFLAAIAETESSCRTNPGNPWGLMQFSDDGAWREFGLNKDRTNPWDAAYAAARYFRALLAETNGNLDQALRLYNGPIEAGGNQNYQAEVRLWMSGGNPWG